MNIMLTYDDLHNFIINNINPKHFSLRESIDMLARFLNAHVTLIDNAGLIIYQKHIGSSKTIYDHSSNSTPSSSKASSKVLDIVYTRPLKNIVPIWVKGHSLGALIVEKENLSLLEKSLLEIASGIISIHMR